MKLVSWIQSRLWPIVAGSLVLMGGCTAKPGEPAKMRLWVPAYYYPGGPGMDEWNHLMASARSVPITAIVNPNSGPGDKADDNYTQIIPRAREAGITLVGYVSTQYAKRPIQDVKAEMDRWLKFYPQIQGFHLDEQASDTTKLDYYTELYRYARKLLPGAMVVTNPGTDCASSYISRPATDVVCLFERDKGFEQFQPPAWTANFPASRFAAQPYAIETVERMQECVTQAAQKHIGCIYVTNGSGANPYNHLPSYWDAEVDAVQRINH